MSDWKGGMVLDNYNFLQAVCASNCCIMQTLCYMYCINSAVDHLTL